MEVISAREKYREGNPNHPWFWKVKTFLNLRSAMNVEGLVNLISIGDSSTEARAVSMMST